MARITCFAMETSGMVSRCSLERIKGSDHCHIHDAMAKSLGRKYHRYNKVAIRYSINRNKFDSLEEKKNYFISFLCVMTKEYHARKNYMEKLYAPQYQDPGHLERLVVLKEKMEICNKKLAEIYKAESEKEQQVTHDKLDLTPKSSPEPQLHQQRETPARVKRVHKKKNPGQNINQLQVKKFQIYNECMVAYRGLCEYDEIPSEYQRIIRMFCNRVIEIANHIEYADRLLSITEQKERLLLISDITLLYTELVGDYSKKNTLLAELSLLLLELSVKNEFDTSYTESLKDYRVSFTPVFLTLDVKQQELTCLYHYSNDELKVLLEVFRKETKLIKPLINDMMGILYENNIYAMTLSFEWHGEYRICRACCPCCVRNKVDVAQKKMYKKFSQIINIMLVVKDYDSFPKHFSEFLKIEFGSM